MQNVGLSMSDVGLMWAARAGLSVLAPFVWGYLADRAGDARPFAITALFGGCALLVALSMTTSAAAAIAIFALYGFVAAPSGSTLDGMTLTALKEHKHRFGSIRLWGTVGFGVTSLSSAFLLDAHVFEARPSTVFPACAVLTGLGGAVLFLLPRLERARLGDPREVFTVLRRREVGVVFLTGGLLWASHLAYSSFLTPLASSVGLPEWSVGVAIASGLVIEALAFAKSGVLLARFGARRTLIGAAALTVVRWLLAALVSDPWSFIALHALHGVTFGVMYVTLVQLLSERVPDRMRQTAQSALGSSALGLGGAVGALVAGSVYEHIGARETWLAMAGIASVGCAVSVWGTRALPTESAR
jgi:MFS transporter, PPP family, 3-phenylpropionic acid transporter